MPIFLIVRAQISLKRLVNFTLFKKISLNRVRFLSKLDGRLIFKLHRHTRKENILLHLAKKISEEWGGLIPICSTCMRLSALVAVVCVSLKIRSDNRLRKSQTCGGGSASRGESTGGSSAHGGPVDTSHNSVYVTPS